MKARELCCGRCQGLTSSDKDPGAVMACGVCGCTLTVGERYSIRLGFTDAPTHAYFKSRVGNTPGVFLYWAGSPEALGMAAWLWAESGAEAVTVFTRLLAYAHGGLCSSVEIFLREVEVMDDEDVPPLRLLAVQRDI